jgi:hypothetical protein
MLKLQRLKEIPWSRLARGVPRALPSFSSMQWSYLRNRALQRERAREPPREEQTLKIRAGYDVAFNCLQEVPMVPLAEYTLFRQSVLTKHVMISRGRRTREFKDGFGNVLIACKEQPPPHWIVSMVTVSNLAATVPTNAMRYYVRMALCFSPLMPLPDAVSNSDAEARIESNRPDDRSTVGPRLNGSKSIAAARVELRPENERTCPTESRSDGCFRRGAREATRRNSLHKQRQAMKDGGFRA